MLDVNAILTTILCITTTALAIAQFYHQLNRQYLLRLTGSRARLALCGLGIWSFAAAISTGVWLTLLAFLAAPIALALFFAFEALILDFCVQRIQYVRVSSSRTMQRAYELA